mmetsp:Transcript_9390/g.17611  ORF Transcript_9390/g.17611 Transcript_9390/m.17611 type:complete len:235 (-) Transcript_9390:745-1449(-)
MICEQFHCTLEPVELPSMVIVLHHGHQLSIRHLSKPVVPANLVDVWRVHQPDVWRPLQSLQPLAMLRLAVVVDHQIRTCNPHQAAQLLAQPLYVLLPLKILHDDRRRGVVRPVRAVLPAPVVLVRFLWARQRFSRPQTLESRRDSNLGRCGDIGLPIQRCHRQALPPQGLAKLHPHFVFFEASLRGAPSGSVYQSHAQKRAPADHKRVIECHCMNKLHLPLPGRSFRPLHTHHG